MGEEKGHKLWQMMPKSNISHTTPFNLVFLNVRVSARLHISRASSWYYIDLVIIAHKGGSPAKQQIYP